MVVGMLILAFLNSVVNARECNISIGEYNSLEDLYFSTNGANWLWDTTKPTTTRWVFPSGLNVPCKNNWQGLTCSVNMSNDGGCGITALNLPEFNLDGTLPSNFGDLSNLEEIYLYTNSLIGSIPQSMHLLPRLRAVNVGSNILTGNLPLFSLSCAVLNNYDVKGNLFTGVIPSSFGQYLNLTIFYVTGNLLTSTLPSELFGLTKLEIFCVDTNPLSGTFPSGLGNLRQLETVQIFNTQISGTIPTSIGNLEMVQNFVIFSNRLSGSLPSEIGNMKNLQYTWMYSNSLTGTLPLELGQLGDLLRFVGAFNSFVGTLPTTIGLMSSLQDIDVNGNCLSGSIPTEIGLMSNLQYLYLQVNCFSGTLPTELAQLNQTLTQIEIFSNQLSGSIPPYLGQFSRLSNLIMSYNQFSSTLPAQISGLSGLQVLNVSSNRLTGNLAPVFQNNYLDGLVILDLSYNSFHGSIPITLFTCKSITSLSLFSNCFEGSIPDEICNASSMEVLVLDGLTSGFGCILELSDSRVKLMNGLFPDHLIDSTIPSCLWSMSALQTLHLSGNGLTGTIGEIPSNSMLSDLNLANNEIRGSIPKSLQLKGSFNQLDLSTNKLSGTLEKNFVVQNYTKVFELSINRLSGNLPSAFYTLASVNVLAGNLFDCTPKTKPIYDPYRHKSVCGSDDLNNSFFLWIAIYSAAAACFTVIFFCLRRPIDILEDPGVVMCSPFKQERNQLETETKQIIPSRSSLQLIQELAVNTRNSFREWWQSSAFRSPIHNCNQLLSLLGQAAGRVSILASFYLIVCMMTYIILKETTSDFSTHTMQYGWVTTSAFMHDWVPVVFLLLFVVISEYVATRFTRNQLLLELSKRWAQEKRNLVDCLKRENVVSMLASCQYVNWDNFVLPLLLQLANAAMAMTVNGAYVVALINGIKEDDLFALQLALSWFKLLWSSIYVPWAISRLRFRFQSNLTGHQVLMNVVNFIAAPVLATAVSDSDCLYYAFEGQAAITSSFSEMQQFPYCFKNATDQQDCTVQSNLVQLYTSLTPPWLYSYQCSSSLLVNYVPVLIFSFTMSGVLLPLFRMIALAIPSNYWKPYGVNLDLFSRTTPNHIMSDEVIDIRPNEESDAKLDAGQSNHSVAFINWNSQNRRLFRGPDIVTKVLLNFAVLMTFGLASPLLGLTVAVDLVNMYAQWRVLLGRHIKLLNHCQSHELRQYWQMKLNESAGDSTAGFLGGILLVLITVNLFWCFMVFDMIADVYSEFLGGMTVVAAGVGTPLLLVGFHQIDLQCRRLRSSLECHDVNLGSTRSTSVAEIEL